MRYRNVVLLLVLGAAAAAAQTYGTSTFAGSATKADAVWEKAGADEGLRQAFERAAYSLEDSGHGTWRGVNAAQQLTLEFDGRETRLNHPGGSVNFRLAGYGYGDRLQKPAPVRLTGNRNRLEYQRGNLTEWYMNESQGLEQGFTLVHRPGTNRAGEPLVIALGVTGGLTPAQKAEDSVVFESSRCVVLRYAGLRALDAGGRVLPSRLEVRDREVRLIVEDQSAQYPLVIDPTWTQQQELTASDGVAYDHFGVSVSVSGDTAVIGVSSKTISSNARQGAAYVFVRSSGVWSQQQELTASDGAAYDEFGISVSVSGETAVIGAFENSGAQGAAYVFLRNSGVWTQQQKLTASDGVPGDYFGWSVSVSGDTAVIGAYAKINDRGAVYVFVRSSGLWTQQQELTASDGATNDHFGYSVSVSGDTAVIGAYGKISDQGAAYVFVRNTGVWTQQQKLTAWDGAASDYFGYSVSVSGDTAVIGAYGNSSFQGAAYVFVRSSGVWSQQQELTASDGAVYDEFGYSVSVSGDTAAMGAYVKNNSQGAAYVFARSSGVWTQQGELAASDGAANDYFGDSVSVSGGTTLAGASGRNINRGAAYVFTGPMLGVNALLVGAAGGTSSVVLAYSSAWTATANASFLHISTGSASGTGNAVVVFTYDAFTGTGTRMGTLTIAGLTVTVTQVGTNYIGSSPVIALVSSGLNQPEGAAVDGSGNVYIADTGDQAIKEWISSSQQVATLVSSGFASPGSVALDSLGNVYITDTNNQVIKEWSPSSQQMTVLVSSGLASPGSVALDSLGNVYIADSGNNAIKEWSASTQLVTMLVSSGLNNPNGLAVDGAGNVYIADSGNNAIKEWSASTQHVTTLVSSGLNHPNGLAVDGAGNVYIADSGNNAIKERLASTQYAATLVSSGLNHPYGLAVDGSGNVYIADSGNNAVKEVPYAFVGPAGLTEPASAGSDSLLPVLPSTTSLAGIFAPTSDQGWLTIGTIANGVINFSFTANTSSSTRTAHITVLGQQITVTQSAAAAVPVLTVTKTHAGNFTQGQNGATYTVTVSNAAGTAATSGTVTVTETAPSGLSLVSMAGTGWTCVYNTCTRIDSLAAGLSYPAITVTVNVAANANSPQINLVSVGGGGSLAASATDSTIITQTGHPAFFAGEVALGSGIYYLQFPDGNLFGYYAYMGSGFIFHFDMGYEYVDPVSSGNGVYLWDYASGHWFYTNASLFPYLYDFTLNAWIFYFPDTKNAGHYTTNPRYFVNLTTGVIFTM